MIRAVKISDAQNILDIYNHYVLNTVVTFDIGGIVTGCF